VALINCPDCGTAVSDQANACIKCGCPLKGKPKNVMISFPVFKGQLLNNKCKVFRYGRVIAVCKQGETATFECNETFEIEATVGGSFGRPKAIVSPGDRFRVGPRGLGLFITKVESIV